MPEVDILICRDRLNRQAPWRPTFLRERLVRDFTKHLLGNVEGLRPELKMPRGEPGGLFTLTGHAGKG